MIILPFIIFSILLTSAQPHSRMRLLQVMQCWSYSSKADVWACAVLLWQVFSLPKPFQALTSLQAVMFVLEGGRLDRPNNCPLELYWSLLNCWKANPKQRPSFRSLKVKLISLSESFVTSQTPFCSLESLASANRIQSFSNLPPNKNSPSQAPPTFPRRKSEDTFKGVCEGLCYLDS